MKQKLFLTLAMMLTVCSFSRAKEAYAVYDSGDQTLTFRYDDDWANQPTSVYKYKLNTGSNTPGWIADGKKFKRVIFVSSFANYRPSSTNKWFFEQTDLTKISGISNLKTDNVTVMSFMFYGCSGLTSLDVSKFNTTNVTDMSYMFCICSGLTSLDVSKFNTSNVGDMNSMFMNCNSLTSLDVSGWDTSNVMAANHMFFNCNSLTSLDVSGWDTSNVAAVSNIFYNCSGLTSLDVSRWDTSNVTMTVNMFYGCSGLTSLDLSSFNTTNVTNMSGMFMNCNSLKTIYVGDDWNTEKVENSLYMFWNCTQLVGGAGTTYNSGKHDKEYARIDGGPTSATPGYFTIKVYDLKITDTTVTSMNKSDVLRNGIFSYSPSTKTLTVKGSYTVTGSGTIGSSQLIRNNIEGLTIDVIQDAILECEGILIWLQNNTTIKGNGKLTLKSGGDTGIYLTEGASATIENMDMVISSMWGIAGPRNTVGEKITIKSSNITITTSTAPYPDNAAAICDLSGGIILEDCSITYPTNARLYKNGVYSGSSLAKDVTITAKVGISTGLEAIENGQLTIDNSNDSWYTIDGQKLSGKPAKKGIYIQNGKKQIVK